MTKSEYLRQLESDYIDGKIDDDAIDALYLAVDNMEFEPEPDDSGKDT